MMKFPYGKEIVLDVEALIGDYKGENSKKERPGGLCCCRYICINVRMLLQAK